MSGPENARVIQNEQIVLAKKFFQISKTCMFDSFPLTMQDHHARIFSPFRRMLRDQFPRQIVLVVAQARAHVQINGFIAHEQIGYREGNRQRGSATASYPLTFPHRDSSTSLGMAAMVRRASARA